MRLNSKQRSTQHGIILIVDDEPSILKLLSKILIQAQFKIEVARSGEEGIEKIANNKLKLIITDIKMPGVDGIQLMAYSRAKDNLIPVIGISGTPWLMDEDLFDAVLHKPFSNAELVQKVSQLISK